MEKIAILVDVQNVYYTCRERYGRHFNYNQFWSMATATRQVVKANAYAIATHDTRQRQFHHILRGIGFEVVLKPFIQRGDGSTKGDWDVGIALDAYELASQVDTLILVSGDGDFELLVERIQRRFGTRVIVYGVPGLTAKNLIEVADEYQAIELPLLL
ncbi:MULTISPECIES: NYN domain-containing protein [Vibrio]|uniref:LabA-like NYN domain-containing protein n=1 Tax=Vibrio TaxID=662 RepID=UPI000C168E19|nr:MULTISPECIES: NYN domain-containing protein [Vibrio]NAW69102.1 NYN domain-containing protein [Vibrio sp. V28_P6S34P95]NAX06343.1 NYN domain-containing protein [Vibrio sp. V30_P3S12P165]NAX34354.1 NYN domain-containing protein [Vibrio sp. V29_P1S30P107]NAX36067.1 NYN domain-containing protein [Vibrio sp. V27_P1S3P104]NAX41202.1 NYN domain-containing protein [Vibrio sp. V26_P1S5P106]